MTERYFSPGVYAAAATPLHADLSCNHEALLDHCQDLLRRGCQGIVLFGSSGEGPLFSVNERIEALKTLIRGGFDPQKLILGIGCCAIQDAVELANSALECACKGVLVVPSFYYKNVDTAGICAFFRELIKEVHNPNLKILLYHIPQYSGVAFTLEIVQKLSKEFPNTIVGLKESEGNLTLIKEIARQCPGFQIFSGKDSQIAESLKIGADGTISGLANAFPELLISLAAYSKDPQQPNPQPIIESIDKALKDFPRLPTLKKLIEIQKGTAWQVLRPPLSPLTEAQSKQLAQSISDSLSKSIKNV